MGVISGLALVPLGKVGPEVPVQGLGHPRGNASGRGLGHPREMPVGGAADKPRRDQVLGLTLEAFLVTSFYQKSSDKGRVYLTKSDPEACKIIYKRSDPTVRFTRKLSTALNYMNSVQKNGLLAAPRRPSARGPERHTRTRPAQLQTLSRSQPRWDIRA